MKTTNDMTELVDLIKARVKNAPLPKPKLQLVARDDLVRTPGPSLDPVTRDVIYARIRDLASMYWLAWLVRQETESVSGVIECLTDDALCALRDKMERGRECRVEGVGFDDAGLVRSNGESAW